MQYRADIDGLRAIAVIPVILFHAQIPLFSGGFVGVDVFFVISGYLITGLILAEARNNQYTIWGFYRRRIRRILPALFAVLIASSILAWHILLPEDFRNYANSLIATISFASNVFFMRHLDYFATGAEFAPLLHTWSLAIEEQFYIVYPVALWLIFRYLKHRLVHFLTITLLLSFGFSVWLTPANPTVSFYLLPSRAWELLLGAIVAMGTLPRLKSTWRELAAILGLGMIVWGIFSFSALTMHRVCSTTLYRTQLCGNKRGNRCREDIADQSHCRGRIDFLLALSLALANARDCPALLCFRASAN